MLVNMTRLVSVIMPVYNQEKFLHEAIESVLNQTYNQFEFLILDDGSTDSSPSIIKNFSKKDNRIKDFYSSNQGRADSTNILIKRAAGIFCALLDADDIMLPNRLETQLNYHLNNIDIDASSVHCYYIDEKGKQIGIQHYPYLNDLSAYNLVKQNRTIIHCAITGLMIKRAAYLTTGGLDKRFWPCDDFEFINKLIDFNLKILILNVILMKYRFHHNSATSKKQWHMFDKMEFVGHNLNLRRNFEPEIDFEDFIKARNKDTDFIQRLKISMHRLSMIFHRRAGFNLYKKHLLKFSFQIAVASLLDVRYVYASLKNRKLFFKK